MGKRKRDRLKANYMLLCRQYQALGAFLRGEAEAIAHNNMDLAMKSKRAALGQYREIGEQLKRIADDVGV